MGLTSDDVVRPPGPDGLPVIGSAVGYFRDNYGFIERCASEYGDVAYYEVFGTPFYQINSAAAIEHVLVDDADNYVKGELFQATLGPLLGDGLLTSEGETWRRHRRLVGPAFRPDRIAEYGRTMTDRAAAMAETWDDGEVRAIDDDMMTVTLEIVADALFGVDLEQEVETIGAALDVVLDYQENVLPGLLPYAPPTPARRRYERAIDRLDSVVDRIIDERANDPGDDVVTTLLTAGEGADDAGLSRDEVRDEVLTLLLAGHETTALALTYTLFLLSRHPRVERRLREELDATLGGDRPTVADVGDLPYLDRVVSESLRLYPPVPTIVREPATRTRLAGYPIPEGATLTLNQWTVHRDERYYDDPLAFDPDRWTDEFEAELPDLAYFPFSAGMRQCIGERFARLEARLVLATLLQEYRFELVSDPDLDLIPTITARPSDPVRMRVDELSG